jgi:membrane protein required for colicin V production
MEFGTNFTTYDFMVLGALLLLISRGLWLGFLRQIIGLVALYVGYIIASQYHDKLFPFLRDFSSNPKVVFLCSYALLFIATYILAMLLGKGLGYVIQITMAGWFDRMLGGVLGFAKGVLLVVLVHMILGAVLAPESQILRTCETCDELNIASNIARELIRNEDARKALMQQAPAITAETIKGYLTQPPGLSPALQDSLKVQPAPAPAGRNKVAGAPAPSGSPAGQQKTSSFWDDISSPGDSVNSRSGQ